jgi:putative redox protein
VQASAEQDPEPPWTFRKIHLKFILKGEGLTENNIQKAICLSEEKYCSVAATLRGIAEISTSFEILED